MEKDSIQFDGKLFLENVNLKLKKRLHEIQKDLDQGLKEVENMHDYYWENYTEMDQYGYEDYDNQQALLQQVNANRDKSKLMKRLEKMIDSPFFGRVDFIFEGEDEPEPFYIGIGNFSERAGMMPLIYDWRAPVSGLFYDFDKGPGFYEAPSGTIHGEVSSKWQYKVREGKMVYGFESDIKIDDEILKQELGSSGDIQLKNIVRTIQKEQNAIIRNTKDKILVIQGAAGSGKTSIALHRIAYLLYHDRKNLKSSNILILSPNSVFADYISHILPELGEENIQEMSFDVFAYKELRDTAYDCEDRYDQLERMMRFNDQKAQEIFQWKQSPEFIAQAEGYFAILEDELMDFHDIEFRGMKLTEEELIHLFYSKFYHTPLLKRMDAVMEYFVDSYETLRGRNIEDEDRDFLQKKFDGMYVTKDIYIIYNQLLEYCEMDGLSHLPYERRKISFEDVYPMLYVKYRLTGRNGNKNIKHLVIDEMQDYSYVQYLILHELFHCKMTILGDRAQTLGKEQQDVLKFLPKIFGKDIRTVIMNKSYRNTREIADYAAKIGDVTGIELLDRHGKEVVELTVETDEEMFALIDQYLSTVKQQENDDEKTVDNGKYETAAILAMTEEEASDLYRILEKRGVEVNYIDRNSSSFRKGLTVTTYYLAKGLEFDQVFIAGMDSSHPFSKQALYISATRALHELYVFHKK